MLQQWLREQTHTKQSPCPHKTYILVGTHPDLRKRDHLAHGRGLHHLRYSTRKQSHGARWSTNSKTHTGAQGASIWSESSALFVEKWKKVPWSVEKILVFLMCQFHEILPSNKLSQTYRWVCNASGLNLSWESANSLGLQVVFEEIYFINWNGYKGNFDSSYN